MDATDDPRRKHLRHALLFLIAALLLILIALVLLASGAPEWNADGSRAAYPWWIRALLAVCLATGTVSAPLALRSLVLALVPSGVVGVVMGIVVGIVGMLVVPAEIWLAMGMTDAEQPGARERLESGGDWDWD